MYRNWLYWTHLLLALVNLGVDTNSIEYVGHFFGVNAAIVGHILLTTFVDIHVASLALKALLDQAIE
jgi:hypothetical protein